MDPLSRFYSLQTDLTTKLYSISLILIVVFDFFFFPLPILAADDGKGETAFSANKAFYLVSQNSNDLFYLVGVNQAEAAEQEAPVALSADEETIIPTVETKTAIKTEAPARLPANPDRRTLKSGWAVITAYNSEAAQCDASPCITANGFNVCKHGIEDTVAANGLPFGTKIKIPDLFGDRIFIVRDRMNARYTDRVDVWMKNKTDALQLGVREAKIEILE